MIYKSDIAICGGGLVGLTLALALARYGINTTIIDSTEPSKMINKSFDGRYSSIALGSKKVLESIGIWSKIEDQAEPILEIRVSDGKSPLFLHYDHSDLGEEPLGWMVENRLMRAVLISELSEYSDILNYYAPMTVKSANTESQISSIELSDGKKIYAELLVAADGRNSFLRSTASIGTIDRSYNQVGIVCTVKHEKSHRNIAHERFLPSGPFAILPTNGNRSSLVWTERKDIAPRIMKMHDSDFLNELLPRFGDFLGDLELEGPRWSYPLSLRYANRYTSKRLALIGDAAHSIHPIAGQGLNLGIRDCAALTELVVNQKRLGLDIGTDDLLDEYHRWRQFDSMLLISVTHSLNHLFSNDIRPLQLLRGSGLAAVHKFTPVKKLLMRRAMGLAGDLPRLARGEQL